MRIDAAVAAVVAHYRTGFAGQTRLRCCSATAVDPR